MEEQWWGVVVGEQWWMSSGNGAVLGEQWWAAVVGAGTMVGSNGGRAVAGEQWWGNSGRTAVAGERRSGVIRDRRSAN